MLRTFPSRPAPTSFPSSSSEPVRLSSPSMRFSHFLCRFFADSGWRALAWPCGSAQGGMDCGGCDADGLDLGAALLSGRLVQFSPLPHSEDLVGRLLQFMACHWEVPKSNQLCHEKYSLFKRIFDNFWKAIFSIRSGVSYRNNSSTGVTQYGCNEPFDHVDTKAFIAG